MFGRMAVAVGMLALALVCRAAVAEEEDSASPRRLPTLSERLEQFRQDLLGSGSATPRRGGKADESAAGRGSSDASRPISSPIQAAPSATPTLKPAAPTVTTTDSPSGVAAKRLEAQAARKAVPGNRPNAVTVEPTKRPTAGAPGKVAPTQQPESAVAKPAIKRAKPSGDDEPKKVPLVARAPALVAPKDRAKSEDDEPAVARDERGKAGEILFTTQSPVLAVEAVGPRKVLIGREAQFVVRIRNSGAAANNVTVTINIPAYVDVASAQASAGTAEAPAPGDRREPMEWRISRLDAKASETLQLALVPRKSTPLDLGIQWTFVPEISQTLVEVQEPKLAMNITGPDEVLFGQSKIYKLTVSNPGNGDTDNVMIGLLPIGRTTEATATHRVGTLRAGESKTIDIELTARQAGVVTIKAQAFADGGLRAEAVEQVMVRRASLHVEVEAPKVKYAGTVGTYRVKVVNAGNAPAENVQVAAVLPPEAKFVSSGGGGRLEPQQGKVTWLVGTLQAGAERIFDMQCSLNAPGENRMQFITMADGDLSAAGTSSTRVEALADLKLEVRDPQGPIAVGDDAVYEIHIRNRGTKSADGVELAVFFSEGLEATSVEGTGHEIGAGQVGFRPVANLGAGESVSFRVHTRSDRPGNHVFRAEVVCRSLETKLATEETTHFYGDERAAPADRGGESEPTPVRPLEPVPAEANSQDSE